MKYILKDGVNFEFINETSKMKYNFDLTDYYDEETRLFEFSQDYLTFYIMGILFREFLIPLNLVELVEE